MKCRVEITETCLLLIESIPDKRIQKVILSRVDSLRADPAKRGKPLVKDLAGFRSMHAAKRYRILYRIDEESNVVWAVAAGIRKEGDQKDIYEVARRLLRLGLLQ
ncbi:MAG: type II toxin-antitoxin system RelE/ParE family toxin [Thermodesulfobacteriota bacterium]